MDLILLLGFPSAAAAFTTFSPNCTALTEQVNFVESSNTRSTLDILWSCLFTLFTCTWTVLHLYVPQQREGRDPGRWGDLKWKMRGFLRTLLWMMGMLIAPELIMLTAVHHLILAIEGLKTMKQQAFEDRAEWTLTHAFFANMGGWAIEIRKPLTSRQDLHELAILPEITPSFLVTNPTAGLPIIETATAATDISNSSTDSSADKKDSCIVFLNSKAFLELRRDGIIPKVPNITVDEINDKSKSDIFVKSLAIIQVSSVVIQVISRHVQRLAISQLELTVTAFAFCAVVAFLLLFYMPKGVQTPMIIPKLSIPLTFQQAVELIEPHRHQGCLSSGFDRGLNYWSDSGLGVPPGWDIFLTACLGLFGALFGAIHCLAWSFTFPTGIEQTLWRIASIAITAIPLMVSVFSTDWAEERLSSSQLNGAIGSLASAYAVARVFIIVETFRTLFFLPPSAFVSKWASSIPQFG